MDNELYEGYYLNFISAINRQKLEDLAQSSIDSNSVVSIRKVRIMKQILIIYMSGCTVNYLFIN